MVKGKGTAADVFVPFAFEVGGALVRTKTPQGKLE